MTTFAFSLLVDNPHLMESLERVHRAFEWKPEEVEKVEQAERNAAGVKSLMAFAGMA